MPIHISPNITLGMRYTGSGSSSSFLYFSCHWTTKADRRPLFFLHQLPVFFFFRCDYSLCTSSCSCLCVLIIFTYFSSSPSRIKYINRIIMKSWNRLSDPWQHKRRRSSTCTSSFSLLITFIGWLIRWSDHNQYAADALFSILAESPFRGIRAPNGPAWENLYSTYAERNKANKQGEMRTDRFYAWSPLPEKLLRF